MTDLPNLSFDIFDIQSDLMKDHVASNVMGPVFIFCNCPSFGAKLANDLASLKWAGSSWCTREVPWSTVIVWIENLPVFSIYTKCYGDFIG